MCAEHPTLARTRAFHDELIELRRQIHAYPEAGLQTPRTASLVATKLRLWGLEVHEGIGGSGVVGVLRRGHAKRSIGLRAELDALIVSESGSLPYASTRSGVMHACGHDGHAAMLLGAARYLAEAADIDGVVNFIFQPGEEGVGGALAMLEDRLFERFPCDQLFALHNRPGLPVGEYAYTPGVAMAGGAFFEIEIMGEGGHGARPEKAANSVAVACQLGVALQSVVQQSLPAVDAASLTLTTVKGGELPNVIPPATRLAGTVRAMTRENLETVGATLQRISIGIAEAFETSAAVDFRIVFAPLENDSDALAVMTRAATDLVGSARVNSSPNPSMASEDFSFMIAKVRGAYMAIGNGVQSAAVHTPHYDFNDDAIPFGTALFARIVERQLGSM